MCTTCNVYLMELCGTLLTMILFLFLLLLLLLLFFSSSSSPPPQAPQNPRNTWFLLRLRIWRRIGWMRFKHHGVCVCVCALARVCALACVCVHACVCVPEWVSACVHLWCCIYYLSYFLRDVICPKEGRRGTFTHLQDTCWCYFMINNHL